MLNAQLALDPVIPFPTTPLPAATAPASTGLSFPVRNPVAHATRALGVIESGAWGNRMARHLNLPGAPALSILTRRKAQLAVTRLQSQNALPHRTAPFRPEQAFIVQLHLQNVSSFKLWQHGRALAMENGEREGSVSILDLHQDPCFSVGPAFDILQFYISRAALDEYADESGACRCETLHWPCGKVDGGLRNLATCLLPVLEDPSLAVGSYVDHLVLAIHGYIAQNYGGITSTPSVVRGGLAPWQLHRAKEMMKANLDGQIGLAQVARECKLSVSHFVRAFKQTVGEPPYRWLSQLRIETAKELLLHSDFPMVEIALKCGFADQACFIRAFRKLLNVTPGEWRRMRMQ
jgi:AraC family transcriptional regulator